MDEMFTCNDNAKVVEAMSTSDNWAFNSWRSCASGHVYLVGRSFSSLIVKIKMENCLSPSAPRCGGPLEERPCPVEGCEETIGGAKEKLNASNRLEGNLILFAC